VAGVRRLVANPRLTFCAPGTGGNRRLRDSRGPGEGVHRSAVAVANLEIATHLCNPVPISRRDDWRWVFMAEAPRRGPGWKT